MNSEILGAAILGRDFGAWAQGGGFERVACALYGYKGRPRPAEPPKAPSPAQKDAPAPTKDAPKPAEPPKDVK